jgi:hypothetical protein
MLFEQFAKGRDAIVISNSGMLQAPLQAWADEHGITSGQINRERFTEFLKSNPALFEKLRSKLPMGGGAGNGGVAGR